MTDTKNTPLCEEHRQLGARIVPFAGFSMPLQYSGIVDEHRAVRSAAGLFDVSHMGQFFFSGPRAIDVLQQAVTNDIASIAAGQAIYTPICGPDGGIVDDCVVYLERDDRALMIVNAANIAKDFEWLARLADGRCQLTDASSRYGLIAIQGPRAAEIADTIISPRPSALGRFRFGQAVLAGCPCTVSRTGYTGEDGFEVLCSADDAVVIWRGLLEAGRPLGLIPVGLGARDTLRLEARLLLHGSDIDATTTPLEAGLGWTVKFDKAEFCGKDALLAQRDRGVPRKLCCLVMRSRGIARGGHTIHAAGEDGGLGLRVGHITSGTMSPTLGQAIALGYVSSDRSAVGQRLAIDVRGKAVQAEIVKGPFYRAGRSRAL